MATPAAHPPSGWAGTAEEWRRAALEGSSSVVVERRAWGRVRWTRAGNVVDVLVREPGRRISIVPTATLLAAAAALLVLAVTVLEEGAVAGGVIGALALVWVTVLVARRQLRAGRTFAGPTASAIVDQVTTLTRIAGRHGGRHHELAAAGRDAPAWLWALADPTLTPAERQQLEDAVRREADLAVVADREIVALDRAPGETPALRPGAPDASGLGELVDALRRTRAELEAGPDEG